MKIAIKKKIRQPTTWDNVPLFFGLSYASLLLGVSESTVKKWVQDGDVPAFKVGDEGKWFFKKEAFIKWVDERIGLTLKSS